MPDTHISLPHAGAHYSSFLFAQEAANQDDGTAQADSVGNTQAFLGLVQAHREDSAALLRQISVKAPQLAAVLDLFDAEQAQRQAQAPARVTFSDPAPGGAVLEMTTGMLANVFPIAAPLLHSCRTYLQLRLMKKKAG